MDEKTYTVTLDDGTELTDLRLNGNNFISSEPISEEIFEDNLATVQISDGENTEMHEHMALVQVVSMPNDEYWFVLRDVTSEEMEQERVWAAIDYLAMMTNTEI